MNVATKNAIMALIQSDSSINELERKVANDLCNGNLMHRRKRLILRKEVLQILGISIPTLRKYIRMGLVKEIKLSKRKSRFDYDEIISFADNGVDTDSQRTINVTVNSDFTTPHGDVLQGGDNNHNKEQIL